MFFLTVFLAALSAGALADDSVFLTAFDPADTSCTGNPVGNNLSLSDNLQPHPYNQTWSPCIVYEPGHGQNIKLDYGHVGFFLEIYNETGCDPRNLSGQLIGWAGSEYRCIPMDGGKIDGAIENAGTSDWKSVLIKISHA